MSAGVWAAVFAAVLVPSWFVAGQKDKDKPAAPVSAGETAPVSGVPSGSVLDYTLNRIDGTPQSLAEYRGKVLLFVNVASQCGYTPQYEGLERLYEEKKDQGLVVIGFPANNFGSQEPGTNLEIAEFCTSKFGVSFPLFEKISVKGEDAHPLYQVLAGQPSPIGGEPKWNFTKFLVDRSGKVVARYEPKARPDDPALIAQIDKLLAEKP
jgi:glutathione peroxidase